MLNTAFKNDPDTVYSFYNKRRRELNIVKPNQAFTPLLIWKIGI